MQTRKDRVLEIAGAIFIALMAGFTFMLVLGLTVLVWKAVLS